MKFLFFIVHLLLAPPLTNAERVGLGLIVPKGWDHDVLPYSFVIRRALSKLQEEGKLPKRLEWDLAVEFGCDYGSAITAGADLIYRHNVSVLFGATFSTGTIPLGLMAAEFNLPLFPNSAKTSRIGAGKKEEGLWNTTARVIDASDPIGRSLAQWLEQMGWLEVGLMANAYGSALVYDSIKKGLVDPITVVEEELFETYAPFDDHALEHALEHIGSKTRVIILAFATIVPGEGEAAARFILQRAKGMGMVGPDWVWIIPLGMDLTMTPSQLELMPSLYANPDPEMLRQTFVHMPASRSDHQLLDFMNTLLQWVLDPDAEKYHPRARDIFAQPWERLEWHVLMVMLTHDAALLYGLALGLCFAEPDCDIRDGAKLMRRIRHLDFVGTTGPMHMKETFDRAVSYNVFGLNPATLKQEVYWTYTLEHNHSVPETNALGVMREKQPFPWATADGLPPPYIPLCGLSNEHCAKDPTFIVVSAVLGALLLLSVVVMLGLRWRQRQFERETLAKSWEFHVHQVQLVLDAHHTRPTSAASSFPGSAQGSVAGLSTSTMNSERVVKGEMMHGVVHDGVDHRGFIGQGRLSRPPAPKRSVALKQYARTQQLHIRLHSELVALKSMIDLDQDNVTDFVGLSLDCEQHLLVGWEHCSKGSLSDLVFDDEISLDTVFKASIVQDIVRGLEYLHNSPLGVHGQLSLGNCAVSGRWLVKLTDFGVQEALREHRLKGHLSFKPDSTEKLLHLAPELLPHWRQAKGLVQPPTKAADIYSLAMVMYQVLTRQPLYDSEAMTEEEAKDNLLSGRLTGLRPSFPDALPDDPEGELARHLGPLTRRCWQWDPETRPTIRHVHRVVKEVKSAHKNIVEHIMSVLEKYAGSLEVMVAARTDQVAAEKKRADDLLARMMPGSVAEKLKRGELPPPELYDSVTVFFSDVAGFVDISSRSDPIQVVTLLNTLYNTLDELIQRFDAYKVETIGDSYMVVSGLPNRNGSEHVVEIARMALEMEATVARMQIPHLKDVPLQLRIGFHSGPCAAGVVGMTMPRYCLFGDTVNTASRMETTSQAGSIQASEAAATLLEEAGGLNAFRLTFRGTVTVKGKGEMRTFWLMPSTGSELNLLRLDKS